MNRIATALAVFALGLASSSPEPPHGRAVETVAAATPGAARAEGRDGEAWSLPAGVAATWWSAVRAQIGQEAYALRPADNATPGAFEAGNPAQRWMARFTSMGMVITPTMPEARDRRDPGRPQGASDALGWSVGLRLTAYGAGGLMTPVSPVPPWAAGARVEFKYGEGVDAVPAMTEWYVNGASGIEHGFTLATPPAGTGPLTLELAVDGGLQPFLEPDGLGVELRARDGAVRVRYAGLVVTDAGGRTLPGSLAVPSGEPARIHLVVDTRGAAYPVTIDPLLTTPSTTLTGEGSNNDFGWSVAPAGDVNGDGYADVVVGAWGYPDAGYTGRAYVYLGGQSGLATAPATTLTGEAAGNYFGYSVATAGDVNGDGYADVVVGAYGYGANTGRAYVYLGGSTGTASTPTTLTGAAGTVFGISVATAGDVNGDGYADVVIGASGYSDSTGRAYLYLGSAAGLATTATTTLAMM